MITETTGLITLIPENIPEELTERPQWVCWRFEERDEKLTKVPYTPEGQRASTADLMTWDRFEYCYGRILARENREKAGVRHFEAVGAPIFDGIGFVFSSADPFVGIDLDDCRDPETGELAKWAQQIVDRVQDGYTEVSPSGTGIHIIVKGSVRGGGMRKGGIEMYSRGRFFAITGHVL
jgi:putative DNA primase/helicase